MYVCTVLGAGYNKKRKMETPKSKTKRRATDPLSRLDRQFPGWGPFVSSSQTCPYEQDLPLGLGEEENETV